MRLLRKGLEFHVCTINKSAYMKKSLETYLMILVSLLCGPPGRQSPRFGRLSLFCWLSLSLVDWPWLGDSFVSQNPVEVCESRSSGRIQGCAYTNYSYDHNFKWITFSSHSFCTKFLHLLVIWLFISALSPHNLLLQFCFILYIYIYIFALK